MTQPQPSLEIFGVPPETWAIVLAGVFVVATLALFIRIANHWTRGESIHTDEAHLSWLGLYYLVSGVSLSLMWLTFLALGSFPFSMLFCLAVSGWMIVEGIRRLRKAAAPRTPFIEASSSTHTGE